MKALVYVSPNMLQYRDEDDPAPQGDEVLLLVAASAGQICTLIEGMMIAALRL